MSRLPSSLCYLMCLVLVRETSALDFVNCAYCALNSPVFFLLMVQFKYHSHLRVFS